MLLSVAERRRSRSSPAYGFASQGVGVLLFVLWFLRTDWMMQHFHGPPVLLLAALGGLLSGIGATSAGGVLAVVCRRAGATPQATVRGCMCWASLLVLTLLSGLLSWYGLSWLPRVMARVRLSHFDALERRGAAALTQLTAGLTDKDPYLQARACYLLGKLGPSAAGAVPHLISYLESRTGAQTAPTEAVWALGKIGAAAEPAGPLLVRLANEERSSWYLRVAVAEALRGVGPACRDELATVLESMQALAARELPTQTEALKSADPDVVRAAADHLFSMGAYAEAALPALRSRLAEVRQDPTKRDWRWKAPEGALEMAVLGITQASTRRP